MKILNNKIAAFIFVGAYALIAASVRHQGLITNEEEVKKTLKEKGITFLSISEPSKITGCREFLGEEKYIGYACSDGKITIKTANKKI